MMTIYEAQKIHRSSFKNVILHRVLRLCLKIMRGNKIPWVEDLSFIYSHSH